MAERLKSASPEAPNGGGFDPTFTAGLRVGLDRVVDDSSATLAAAGEALIQSGRLGHLPQILRYLVRASKLPLQGRVLRRLLRTVPILCQ